MDASSAMAIGTVGVIAWLLLAVRQRPPPEFCRESRSIPIRYSGLQQWQDKHPHGAKIVYHHGQPEWNPPGVDAHSNHYGII